MPNETDPEHTGPDIFMPTVESDLSFDVEYDVAYYHLAQFEYELGDFFEEAKVLFHEQERTVSSQIAMWVMLWLDFLAHENFAGQTLWEIYLPKPIRRGPRPVERSKNRNLSLLKKRKPEALDPELFTPACPTDVRYDIAFYHVAEIRFLVNDFHKGSVIVRSGQRRRGWFTIEGLINALANLGVSGRVVIEIYLPRPILRNPRPGVSKEEQLIKPSPRAKHRNPPG
jgi:hypothetical protein